MFLNMLKLNSIFNARNVIFQSKLITPRILPQVCNVSSKSVEERLGIPEKPKKPLTPYFRFLKETRPEIQKQNPKSSTIEIVQKVAEKWKTVNETAKKKFEDEFKKDQAVYVEKLAQYDQKLTPEQKEEIKNMKQELSESREKRAFKKKVKELDKPKRPASAFLRFLAEQKDKLPRGQMSYREWQTKATENWNQLSETNKNEYIRLTRVELENYKRELAKWELKMVRLGHVDVVRSEALMEPHQPKPRRSKPRSE